MKPRYYPVWLLLITGIYFLAAKLGLSQAFIHANVSPVWPPTGLAIAIVWWLGYRISPAILLGAFLVNLATGVSVATAGGIAAGNTLEAVSAVFLLHRFVGLHNPFYRAQDVVRFILITAGISTPLSASIGNLSLCFGGAAAWADFAALWLTWWLGDAVGGLVMAPLLLTWVDSTADDSSPKKLVEAVSLLASLLIVSDFVFGGLFLPKLAGYPLEHLMLPFLFWGAFRFGPRGAATTVTVLSGIAIWGTRRGFGPFAVHSPNESLLLLQVFVAAASITALVLAAIVAERKRTEAALRGKETQLQLITDITPVMLTQCSRDLRYRFVNRAYADMLRLTRDQIVGKPISEVMGEEAYRTIAPHVERVLKGHPVEYEAEVPYQRVGRRFMRAAFMPDVDEHGAVLGWIASLMDITDRKTAEEQIRTLNAELQRRIDEFQALIDTAPAGIAVAMDPECNFIWGNPEFAYMLGTSQTGNFSKSGPTGDKLPFRMVRNGKEVQPEDLPMQRACREGRDVLDQELEIVRSDGTVIHELCSATPLRDEQGNVRGCIGVFLDITQRKQGEKERDQLLVREQQARADAEAANQVKDEFLAIVSHELRTPLTSILGWAHLLRTGRLDARTAERAMETIERNGRAQANLVDDLLDVSRIISDKLPLDSRPIELTSVINAAVESLRYVLDAKEIQLQMILEPGASHIQGDLTRLQQVMWNLLSNSAKFTPERGRIEIRLERKGSDAQLTVTDTGEGIRADFLPYVFDRFRQGDTSRTRKHGGLGLGLAIVRHLVKMHGGTVQAFSAGENQGATFTVTLPLLLEASQPESTYLTDRPTDRSSLSS